MDSLNHFRAQAIIFDKDGTLIEFDAMWAGWTVRLAGQLHAASGLNVDGALFRALGYDRANGKVLANGMLAVSSMAQLHKLTVDVMQAAGLNARDATYVVERVWCIPDPVTLARPFTDTRALFDRLRRQHVKIAIATADDRAPTQAMVEALDIAEFIATMICADDGMPAKPQPATVRTICERMNVDPSKAMVVGDTASDMKMARAAGAGLAVGVLSGVSGASDLIPYADAIIDSVDSLHGYAALHELDELPNARKGSHPDPASPRDTSRVLAADGA